MPDNNEVQERFNEAGALGVSPCAWLPPQWSELKGRGNKFADTPPDLTEFNNNAAAEERLKKGQSTDLEPVDDPDSVPSDRPGTKKKWVSPFADFAHIDDREFSMSDVDLISHEFDSGDGYGRLKAGAEIFEKHREKIVELLPKKKDQHRFSQIIDLLRALQPGGANKLKDVAADIKPGQPIGNAIAEELKGEPNEQKAFESLMNTLEQTTQDGLTRLSAVNRLKRIVGAETAGMKRLGRLYDWVLYRTTELLKELNDNLNNEEPYTEARDNYIAFLRDLDDHEPGAGGQTLDPRGEHGKATKRRKSGYGITVKWTCLHPVIKDGKIIGARVICQWNPHSSSSGIAIQH